MPQICICKQIKLISKAARLMDWASLSGQETQDIASSSTYLYLSRRQTTTAAPFLSIQLNSICFYICDGNSSRRSRTELSWAEPSQTSYCNCNCFWSKLICGITPSIILLFSAAGGWFQKLCPNQILSSFRVICGDGFNASQCSSWSWIASSILLPHFSLPLRAQVSNQNGGNLLLLFFLFSHETATK